VKIIKLSDKRDYQNFLNDNILQQCVANVKYFDSGNFFGWGQILQSVFIMDGDQVVGVSAFSSENNVAAVYYMSVVEKYKGKGYGKKLLSETIRWVEQTHKKITFSGFSPSGYFFLLPLIKELEKKSTIKFDYRDSIEFPHVWNEQHYYFEKKEKDKFLKLLVLSQSPCVHNYEEKNIFGCIYYICNKCGDSISTYKVEDGVITEKEL
jgi:GNAT superfamily N-acetyltransferase